MEKQENRYCEITFRRRIHKVNNIVKYFQVYSTGNFVFPTHLNYPYSTTKQHCKTVVCTSTSTGISVCAIRASSTSEGSLGVDWATYCSSLNSFSRFLAVTSSGRGSSSLSPSEIGSMTRAGRSSLDGERIGS